MVVELFSEVKKTKSAKTKSMVIVEGIAAHVDLDLRKAFRIEQLKGSPNSPLVYVFKNRKTGRFLRVFDHRKSVINQFNLDPDPWALSVDSMLSRPCRVSFRCKTSLTACYIVLNDLPSSFHLGMTELILTLIGSCDRKDYVIAGNGKAIHRDTGICLLEPKRLSCPP